MFAVLRHRLLFIILFGVTLLMLSGGVWRFGYIQSLDQLSARGRADLELAADRLTAHLMRYRQLAVLLAEHPTLTNVADTPESRLAAQKVLLDAADKTSALDIIYTDIEGNVRVSALDAGNYWQDAPYFQRAVKGALGSGHGVSPVHGRRAFYFAAPEFQADGPVDGVVIVVVEVETVEWDWRGSRPAVFFVDQTGEVFISNRSELVFWQRSENGGLRPDEGDEPDFRSYIQGGHEIWHIDWGAYVPEFALHIEKSLPIIGMSAEAVVDAGPARRIAGLQAGVVAALFCVFGLILWQVVERRRVLAEANLVLESRVAQRTSALEDTNRHLRHEVSERQEAEAALKKAQADLVQAGKLSALGQMSAGISHELNQPLQAIQQFAENGATFMARGKTERAGENLERISGLATRMARIIRNLRAFARNESEPMGRVDLVQVIEQAIELTTARLKRDHVVLIWDAPAAPVWALGGEVRLSQVFVNLINNAADAMLDQDERRIELTLKDRPRPLVKVRDIGPGIREPEKIFDPFYSTKAVGTSEGMGLGLSISYGLVQSFGGRIRGSNVEDGPGAEFAVELDPWKDHQSGQEHAA